VLRVAPYHIHHILYEHVGLAQEFATPSDGGRWGDSTLALTLVEV
jgi:hypothetical protein